MALHVFAWFWIVLHSFGLRLEGVSQQMLLEKTAGAFVQGGQLRAIEAGRIGQQAFNALGVA